jgi:hypothetical protein
MKSMKITYLKSHPSAIYLVNHLLVIMIVNILQVQIETKKQIYSTYQILFGILLLSKKLKAGILKKRENVY